MIAIAKPVHNVTEVELPEDATGSHIGPQQTQPQGQGLERDEKELPEPLQELVERRSANLNEEERKKLLAL